MGARGSKRVKKTLSKAAAQFRHAKRRAFERYGLELNKERYMGLCQQIQEGKAVFMGKQSNRLTVWKISAEQVTDFGDPGTVTANVVYDKQRHRIVTFLPPGITDAKGVSLVDEDLPEEDEAA